MATFRMKYVKSYKDRHGKLRCYFRRPGFPGVALPGRPGSVEFAQAYAAAMEAAKRQIGEDRVAPGTLSAIIVDYYESAKFERLTEGTKRTYRRALESFRKGII